jgi:hypothetical protein
MLQADDEDDLLEERMKSPFGSSFRTFNATDYKPIGKSEYCFFMFLYPSLKSSIFLVGLLIDKY